MTYKRFSCIAPGGKEPAMSMEKMKVIGLGAGGGMGRHTPSFIKALGRHNGKRGPSMFGDSIQMTHLTLVFDEILRRAQKIPGVTLKLKIKVV